MNSTKERATKEKLSNNLKFQVQRLHGLELVEDGAGKLCRRAVSAHVLGADPAVHELAIWEFLTSSLLSTYPS